VDESTQQESGETPLENTEPAAETPPSEPLGTPESAPPRRRPWLWWAGGAAVVAALAAGGIWAWTQGPLKGYRAVASVNAARITRAELDGHVAFLTKLGRIPPATPADEAAQVALDRAILDDLINRRLLMAEVERRQIRLEPKEEEALSRPPAAPGAEAQPSDPAKPGPPAADRDPVIREEVRRQILVGRLAEQVTGEIKVSDEDAAKYYGENRQAFIMPGAARLRLLLVTTRAEAEHLRQRIAGGADFAAVARDHSQGPGKESGGDLGWVDLRMLPPALAQAVQAIPTTGLTPVVDVGEKFYVLRVEGRQGERVVPLAEVKEQLKPALLMEKKRARFGEMLAELRKNAAIEIYL